MQLKSLISLFWVYVLSVSFSFGQDSVKFYHTIDTLCSPYFYGRAYENKGVLKTALYLQERFSNADTLKLQEFTFSLNQFKGTMNLIIDEQYLEPCSEYIPLPQAKSGKGKVEIVFLDSVFFDDEKQIKKFLHKNISQSGIFYNEKLEFKISSNKELRNKIYQESPLLVKLTNGETLRSFSTTAWMPAAFSLKSSCFQNQRYCEYELIQNIETITNQNIIAFIKGRDTTLSELLVCAHYDHVGGYETCFIPGANDNASGIAMLLELYDYYLANPPKRSIRFVAFAGEEMGLIGSKFFVENSDLQNIHFVLNLDLIGAGSKGATVVNATIFPEQFNLLSTINEQGKYLYEIKKRGEAANSDHYYFSKNGIPAFFLYTNGTVGGYHNLADTPDKLEIGYFKSIFALLQGFCSEI